MLFFRFSLLDLVCWISEIIGIQYVSIDNQVKRYKKITLTDYY